LNIHHTIKNIKSNNPVVTVGTFDGLHKGHKTLIERLKELSRETSGETVVITFWPHPRWIIDSQASHPPKLLNTLEEKKAILEKEGIDHLIVLPFTSEFAKLSSEQFIKEIIVPLGTKFLIVGADHQFGRSRTGSYHTLKECAEIYNFTIEQHFLASENKIKISSTQIRDFLKKGRIQKANHYLGYPYHFSGQVIEGKQLGNTIGFPTANLTPVDQYKLIPKEGVYAVKALVNTSSYDGMLNIGTCPTFEKNTRKNSQIEAHLFHFNENIYGQTLQVYFYGRIRDERTFPGINELKAQLKEDAHSAKKILSKPER
jgi:riboflavin kinase/FMN adenylyltransferase